MYKKAKLRTPSAEKEYIFKDHKPNYNINCNKRAYLNEKPPK